MAANFIACAKIASFSQLRAINPITYAGRPYPYAVITTSVSLVVSPRCRQGAKALEGVTHLTPPQPGEALRSGSPRMHSCNLYPNSAIREDLESVVLYMHAVVN